jgi:hypothetical protein
MAYVALLEERVEAGDLSRAEADYKAAKSASAVNRELLDRQQAEEQASVNNRNLQLQVEAQRQQGFWNALYLLFSIQPKAYHIYHHGRAKAVGIEHCRCGNKRPRMYEHGWLSVARCWYRSCSSALKAER